MFFGIFSSNWQERAISELVKTTLILPLILILTVMIQSMDRKQIMQSFRVSIWVYFIIYLYLAYFYFFVFQRPYMGNDLILGGRTGRNTLAFMGFIIFTFSLILSRLEETILKRFFYFSVSIILFFSQVLIGSRLGILMPILIYIFIVLQYIISTSLRMSASKESLIYSAFILLSMIIFVTSIDPSKLLLAVDVFERVSSFGTSNELDGSGKKRLILLQAGWECFLNGPVVWSNGVKNYLDCVMNSSLQTDLILHNDHLSVLNNVGLLGYIIWLAALVLFANKAFTKLDLFNFSLFIGIVSLFFIDAYNSPMLAFLIALSSISFAKIRMT